MTTNEKLKLIKSGDFVILRRTRPTFIQRMIRFTTQSMTEHTEIIGRNKTGDLFVANAHLPAMTFDDFDDRVNDAIVGSLRMIVCRWHEYFEEEHEMRWMEYQKNVTLIMAMWGEVPPYYDTYSIAVILSNVIKSAGRAWLSDRADLRIRQSLKNNEHKVYCTEAAKIIGSVCGDFDLLDGLPSQTHAAPVHMERQLRAGRLKIICDFGDLKQYIFRPNLT